MLKINDEIPNFEILTDRDNFKVSNYKGKNIVVFFFPRADTSGCTAESIAFTNLQKEFDKLERYQVDIFTNPKYTFLDDHAGDGQFLGEVLIRKVQGGIDFETALSTIYGVEYELDNILLCRDRLLCKQEHLRPILERNVVQADSGRYHYRFDGSFPYDDELKQRKWADVD